MKKFVDERLKKATEKSLVKSGNSFCVWVFHQPKAPASLSKFCKVK